MKKKKIGIVTIGQSPRTDIVPEIAIELGHNIEILERGALDDYTFEQISQFFPEKGLTHLVTRMRNGTEIIIAKEKIIPRIEESIDRFNREKTSLILLLCVGDFPNFKSSCLVLQPQKIVDHCVEGIISQGDRLGILIPIQEQENWVRENYSHITSKITIGTASPYKDRHKLSKISEFFLNEDCDLVVMYCMGFNREHAGYVRSITKKPVIVSSSIVARVMSELLE